MELISMFKTARRIASPFLVGVLMGLVAGFVALQGARLIGLEFGSKQEDLTFWGFTVLGGLFGLVDSLSRYRASA